MSHLRKILDVTLRFCTNKNHNDDTTCILQAQVYIQIPPTGHLGLIWRNTAEATASKSTVQGTLRVRRNHCDRSTMYAVAAAHPQSTLKGSPTRSSHETYVPGHEESRCVLKSVYTDTSFYCEFIYI